MRLWPFQSTASGVNGAPPEGFAVMEDLLRRNVEDIFRIERQEVRGATFGWGGELRVAPARALALLEPRFRSFGYTPFLGQQGDLVWIRAVPLAETHVKPRVRRNVILFLVTVLTTLMVGAIGPMNWVNPIVFLLHPQLLIQGVPFAFTLLAILGVHEFGHYLTARWYGASVSLPYFIPAPPPFPFGTLGAIIRMVLPEHTGLTFGDSLLMRFLTWLVFGRIPAGMDVFVHPVALAGWVGLFVTALNLFPVGQLDGGRIAYALFGPWHRQVSIATFVGLMALGAVFRSGNWIVFAMLILLLMGFHHPPPLDDLTPVSRGRLVLGVVCLILLVLLIPPVPIS
jgi:hypothetical protein